MRPIFHFTPAGGWMNDPNGPVFYQGKYHLFYQHNPYSCVWDHMHWGHAVSEDLLHWEHLPIALSPDEQGDIFSGSSVVDRECISGFGSRENPALLVFYTSHHPKTMREEQCMAVSTDGVHFTKYDGNPVLPGKEHTPARDPHVFPNVILGGYSMCITTEKSVEYYHSSDLLCWEKTGEFTLPGYAFAGMIECPCMVDFEIDGRCKYVLMVSMDIPKSEYGKFPESVKPHKRLMQYFVGDFDGKVFLPDASQKEALLVEEGPNFYAGTVFANTEEKILIAWLGNSEEMMKIPTKEDGFCGIMSYPRKLSLVQTQKGLRLIQELYPALSGNEAERLKEEIHILEGQS